MPKPQQYVITPAAQAEMQRISLQYHQAMVTVGVGAIAEAMKAYSISSGAPAVSWYARAVAMVMAKRRITRDLTMAYYRLNRALATGYTVADPESDDDSEETTLDDLREEFDDAVSTSKKVSSAPSDERSKRAATRAPASSSRPVAGRMEGSRPIPVEEIPNLDKIYRAIEREAEQQVKDKLELYGDSKLRDKQREISDRERKRVAKHKDPGNHEDPEQAKQAAEKKRQARSKASDRAGEQFKDALAGAQANVASTAERIVWDGGRDLLHATTQADPRCLGYVRVSRTGHPCGWCAMLISRGLIFYKSKMSATGNAAGSSHEDLLKAGTGGDTYHTNCHCYAEPVYSRDQYFSDPTFEQNRKFAKLWPTVTRGTAGKDAIKVFGDYFRNNTE